ncbi:MAG: hypothetical protein GY943_33430, partial [Chloroflexi bacterium]|nr:hypothetical protein [Chloroflexota bacterium]
MKNKMLWISASIFVVLAVVFAFTDLPIMQVVADPDSVWGYWMQAYGQLPGMLVGLLGSNVLLRLTKLEKSFKSIASAILLFLLVVLGGMGFWADAMGLEIGAKINPLLIVTLSLSSLIILQVWLRRIPDETMQTYKAIAQIAFFLNILAVLITVWGIKIPWGRWTYRDMLEVGDLSLFTPWYLPQGNNGHHSFISGHTAMAFCVLPVVLLFRENKKHYTTAWVLALSWG